MGLTFFFTRCTYTHPKHHKQYEEGIPDLDSSRGWVWRTSCAFCLGDTRQAMTALHCLMTSKSITSMAFLPSTLISAGPSITKPNSVVSSTC